MDTAEEKAAPSGPQKEPKIPAFNNLARTDVLLMMSMAINVFLAVLVAWWAVAGIGDNAGSASARNTERDISRLNAAIERLERTVERKAAEAEQAAKARELPMQADAGASGHSEEEAAPKMRRVLMPDGRLVITTVK